ncbi:MAG: SixA phosphatase family protein [Jatrophihabitans sp.]|uniref:SixA phosphatase family protein n=1 Tax=Jatrophihabitans sp. TaxID=1932789 RepID=UPI003F81A833
MSSARRLYLLRHAKSDWGDPGLADHDRPLNARGVRATGLVADHLRAVGAEVDLVLCSTARRTRETWQGVRGGLHRDPEVRFEAAIYEAPPQRLLDLLRGIDDEHRAVLMIGHNPGTALLAHGLIAGGDPDLLARLDEGYPTAALTTLTFEGTWADLRPNAAQLEGFVRPRDLAG